MFFPEMLECLLGVLHHDDGSIDHRTDCDGNPAKGHDVRGQPQPIKRNERNYNRNRKGDNRDESRTHVPQEEDTKKGPNNAFLDQLFPQCVDGAVNQGAAVVSRNDANPGGNELRTSSSFFLTPSMTLSAFSPYRITTTPPTTSPLPSNSVTP